MVGAAASKVPEVEFDSAVDFVALSVIGDGDGDGLAIEAVRGDGGDFLAEEELVEEGGLAASFDADHHKCWCVRP